MKTIQRIGAQGDVLFCRVNKLPKGVKEIQRSADGLVLAHSETGHHHVVESQGARLFADPNNPFLSYLVGDSSKADALDVVHKRAWDTHETTRLAFRPDAEIPKIDAEIEIGEPKNLTVWEIRRQIEAMPDGWRRVVTD